MIDPAAIPTIPGDMAALSGHATTLTGFASAFPATGGRVDSTWQGLAAVYHAPEAADLFAASAPVRTVSASVGEDVAAVGSAISTYATEVAAIQTRLATLKSQATAFVQSVAGDDDWRESQSKVDEHNGLISGVDAAVADYQDAQRRCANAVLALYSAKRWSAENGDGKVTDSEFGYTAAQLDSAMGQKGALPWGTSEEHDRGFWGDVGSFFGGMWDGAKGFVSGLGALIGYSDGHWSWGTAGTAWKGLGTFAVALGVYSNPVGGLIDQTVGVPGFDKGQLGNTLLGAGKALIAYDEWGKDKSHAAGMTTFNVLSAIIGTKGAGASLRAGGAALEATEIAGVARLGTGLIRAGDVVASLPKVSDVIDGALTRFPGFRLPHIDVPTVDVPPPHVDVPGAPHVDTPPAGVHGPSVGDGLPHTPHADVPGGPHVPHVDAPGGPHVDAPGAPHDGSPVAPHDGTPAAPHDGTPPHDSTPAHDGTPAHDSTPAHDGVPGHDTPAGQDTPVGHDPAGAHHPAGAEPGPADPLPDGVQKGRQPDGSWIGVDHGTRLDLDPHANAVADQALARAARAEDSLTPRIEEIIRHTDGAQRQGEPFVLKAEDSYKRKLATDLADQAKLTPESVAARINDDVRYTMELPDASYAQGVDHAVRELQAQGFEPVKFKVTWDDPLSYKGINTVWRDPVTGQAFELQFHTPESYAAKTVTHDLYDQIRLPGTPADEVARLKALQGEIFGDVPVPADVDYLNRLGTSLRIEARLGPVGRIGVDPLLRLGTLANATGGSP